MTAPQLRPRTPEAVAFYMQRIQETFTTHPPRAQAAALHLSYAYVLKLRARLIAAGAVDVTERAGRRAWSQRAIADIRMAIEQGQSLRMIARRYKATPHAIRQALQERGVHVTRIRRETLWQVRTRNEVAQLFGVDRERVQFWYRQKWLKMRPNGTGNNDGRRTRYSTYLVSDEAILDFLAVRDAWPHYDPDAITDPDWREAAHDARAAAGGRWMSAGDYAEQRGYVRGYGAQQIRRGAIDAPTQKIGTRWYVWVADKELQP